MLQVDTLIVSKVTVHFENCPPFAALVPYFLNFIFNFSVSTLWSTLQVSFSLFYCSHSISHLNHVVSGLDLFCVECSPPHLLNIYRQQPKPFQHQKPYFYRRSLFHLAHTIGHLIRPFCMALHSILIIAIPLWVRLIHFISVYYS